MSYDVMNHVEKVTLEFVWINNVAYRYWEIAEAAIDEADLHKDVKEGAIDTVRFLRQSLQVLEDHFGTSETLRGLQRRDAFIWKPEVREKYTTDQILEYITEAQEAWNGHFWLEFHDLADLLEDMEKYFMYKLEFLGPDEED